MSEEQQDAELQIVKDATAQLGEHFDSVQIFVTRFEPGPDDDPNAGTVNIDFGSGNWFARFGQVENWVDKCRERTKEKVRQERKTNDE